MNIQDAQYDMRRAYLGGGLGVLVSGIVWLIAGAVTHLFSVQAGIVALFIGGMGIHPLSTVLSKAFKHSGKPSPTNPLNNLALEATFLLFVGLFLAYAVSQLRVEWFFLVMLLMIGSRYLIFSTIYGMRHYWLLGASLALMGGVGILLQLPIVLAVIGGGLIEIIFSAVIINSAKDMTVVE